MSRSEAAPIIEVFTQQHCASCRSVEKYLCQRGVAFVVRDLEQDPAALEAIFQRGFMTTPVTRIGEKWIAGFKPKEFDRLLEQFSAMRLKPASDRT